MRGEREQRAIIFTIYWELQVCKFDILILEGQILSKRIQFAELKFRSTVDVFTKILRLCGLDCRVRIQLAEITQNFFLLAVEFEAD